MKGDLNYRRLIGDYHWPITTPFACLTSYFPGPVAAALSGGSSWTARHTGHEGTTRRA